MTPSPSGPEMGSDKRATHDTLLPCFREVPAFSRLSATDSLQKGEGIKTVKNGELLRFKILAVDSDSARRRKGQAR